MSYRRTLSASFGPSRAGLATVGYTLLDDSGEVARARTAEGVLELGGGAYAATLTLEDAFRGAIVWDTGEAPPRVAAEAVEPPSAEALDAVIVEPGAEGGLELNARQALALILAEAAGRLTGARTGAPKFYAAGNPEVLRIAASTDASGRTSVALTPPE